MNEFFTIVFSGGPLGIAIMLVLIGLSLVAAALAFDNVMIVRRGQIVPPGLSEDVRRLVSEGQIPQAGAACRQQPSFLASVVLHGLAEAEGGWAEMEKAMEDATAEQAARLFRRIEYLSVIGNIAPMVGLLGTVAGMLLAFKQVADTEGSAGAAQLAPRIGVRLGCEVGAHREPRGQDDAERLPEDEPEGDGRHQSPVPFENAERPGDARIRQCKDRQDHIARPRLDGAEKLVGG